MFCVGESSTGRWQIRIFFGDRDVIGIDNRQITRSDRVTRLVNITPIKEFGFGNLSGDFGETENQIVSRPERLGIGLCLVPFLIELTQSIGQIEINRPAVDLQKRILLDQLFLLGRTIFIGGLPGFACRGLNLLGQFRQFTLERICDDLVKFG